LIFKKYLGNGYQPINNQSGMKKKSVSKNTLVLIACSFLILSSFQIKAQLAKDKCKFLGNVISGSVPSDFANYWNQITPENSGKWGSVEGTRDVMQWGQLDLAYNTAKNNGFLFKQHTFIWGQQAPNWISSLPPAEQKEEVEEWIKSYCERYPETDFIDVVNEPLHAVPDYAVALGATGLDWVVWSFEKARQYCPNAKLILNDYNIISNDAATDIYITIVDLLKSKNLIDIIGEQGHFLETTPLATIKKNLDKLNATGLPIHISEFDIDLVDDNAQRDKYMEQFPALWTHPGVQGITLWGYKEGAIWRPNAFLQRSNGTERSAMTWLKTYVSSSPGGSFCFPVTGIEDIRLPVRIYPNPVTNSRFNLEVRGGNVQVMVFDGQGKMHKDLGMISPGTTEINMEASPGLYMIRIDNGQQKVYKKIMIN
jgi:endo-1,4-beta-xylanase